MRRMRDRGILLQIRDSPSKSGTVGRYAIAPLRTALSRGGQLRPSSCGETTNPIMPLPLGVMSVIVRVLQCLMGLVVLKQLEGRVCPRLPQIEALFFCNQGFHISSKSLRLPCFIQTALSLQIDLFITLVHSLTAGGIVACHLMAINFLA